jgi:CDP-4-dehydro-6-deoxyglucose reductase, E1
MVTERPFDMPEPQYDCEDTDDKRTKTGYWYPVAFSSWGAEEPEAMRRVQESTRYTMGEEVAAFEREFADYHGMKHGVMVNSGSSANLIMVATLHALGILKRGDKVLVPAIAWSTTYAPFVQYGMNLVIEDVCSSDWNARFGRQNLMDCAAAVFVPVLGNGLGLQAAYADPASHGKLLLVDNCESLGAFSMNGHRAGTQGLMNSFSFFYSHQISAIEGGMVLTDNDNCARLCRILRNHGWTRDVEALTSFDKEYNFTHFGYNVRPLELHAAVAREQLKKLRTFVELRRMNLRYFVNRVEQLKLPVKVQSFDIGNSSPFGLSFCTERRSELVAAFRTRGIDCRLPTGGSFFMHPYGRGYLDSVRTVCSTKLATPNADEIHRTGMFLGNAPWDITDKIETALRVMHRVLKP